MQNKRTQSEKRWCGRRTIYTDIKITFHNRTYYALTRDIGLGGMFIDLNTVLIPKGAHVEVSMLKYGRKSFCPTFETRVAYVTPHGYGLYFTDYQLQHFRQLQEILYAP